MERVKTSLMVSKQLIQALDEARDMIGVSKSDLMSIALAFYLVHHSVLLKSPRKRRKQILEIQKAFQELVLKALESA